MLLRGAVCPNFYRDFMAAAAAKNRPLPAGMAGFVEPCILMEKSPDKKQIATAPMCRGSFVSGCPYRSLGCQSQSAKIMSSRSPVMNLFSIVHITLLSYSYFTPVLYASLPLFASFNLDVFHNFARHVFDSLHNASCVFLQGTL